MTSARLDSVGGGLRVRQVSTRDTKGKEYERDRCETRNRIHHMRTNRVHCLKFSRFWSLIFYAFRPLLAGSDGARRVSQQPPKAMRRKRCLAPETTRKPRASSARPACPNSISSASGRASGLLPLRANRSGGRRQEFLRGSIGPAFQRFPERRANSPSAADRQGDRTGACADSARPESRTCDSLLDLKH